MLSSFLSGTFPGVADSPAAEKCWVFKAISNQREEVGVFSEALTEVEKWGQLQALETKLAREHPLDRDHDCQYDWRVKDILTEACAFAWASCRGLGSPKFSDVEGTPDILLETGNWMEVKAIHPSVEEDKRMQRMLDGGIDSGHVRPAGPGLYKKFSDSLKNAIKKFSRQDTQEASGPNFVFFNLTGLDTPSMFHSEDVQEDLSKWADEWEGTIGQTEAGVGIKLIICFGYQWKSPFRDYP